MQTPKQAYEALISELKEIGYLSSTGSILSWDEQTLLPQKAGAFRGDQVAFISRLCHERLTSQRLLDLLSAVEDSDILGAPDSDINVNVRQTRRNVDLARKLPSALVQELARTSVLAQHAWVGARRDSDFPSFSKWLEVVFKLKREEAGCLGFKEHPYDALLDKFEPGDTAAGVSAVFESLKGPLVELIRKVAHRPKPQGAAVIEGHFPKAAQEAFARVAAATIGFDFEAGRIDTSPHPFCTCLGPKDTRLTTRFDERHFGKAFFATLHETGHGLYQQGLPAEHYGTPCGDYVSMGIHESQSRMWENLVGRRRSFWRHLLPRVRVAFPSVADVSEDDWLRAVNTVEPGFIRVEADEVTYNLHVLLRFELEKALLSGDMKVADLPAAWNEKMRSYLGLTPPDDARGVLQDVHWSAGLVGYFPTYTLGNLYAAQFFAQAQKELGDLDALFARGEYLTLLGWLRDKIHSQGQRHSARALVRKVTGSDLSPDHLLAHLRARAADVYGV